MAAPATATVVASALANKPAQRPCRKRKLRRDSKRAPAAPPGHILRDAADDPTEPAKVYEIEYIPELLTGDLSETYEHVFEAFRPAPASAAASAEANASAGSRKKNPGEDNHDGDKFDDGGKKNDNDDFDNDDDDEDEDEDAGFAQNDNGNDDSQEVNGKSLSKRRLRKACRLTVAELKQLVDKPEVVEWVDVCAADPKLLVELKSLRNVVPVPVHWSLKRRYLQNKRGLEKPPFELPPFIKATGIQTMREAADNPDATLKQKMRERVQPKMGKVIIDYAKLHDAFFKWQTKPEMSCFGDVYYEGKESETRLRLMRPGAELSEPLREALGIPALAPPPWLINMQRYGPPPSYPGLKIPGLNAPIPPDASWGFHSGGWGKPPVDEYGRPLYGDVFAATYDPSYVSPYAAPITREPWGELPPEPDDDDEDDENNDDGDGDGEDDDGVEGENEELVVLQDNGHGAVAAAAGAGAGDDAHNNDHAIVEYGDALHGDGNDEDDAAVRDILREVEFDLEHGGASAAAEAEATGDYYVAGAETPSIPSELDLVKSASLLSSSSSSLPRRPSVGGGADPPRLFTVLQEKKVSVDGMMGSDRVYDFGHNNASASGGGDGTVTGTPALSTGTASMLRGEKKRKAEDDKKKKKRDYKF